MTTTDKPTNFGSNGASGFGMSALMGADAQATLAEGFQRSLVQVNKAALREMMFLRFYLGETEAQEIIDYVMVMKFHQSPSATRKIVQALQAISLFDFFGKKNLQVGGK